MHTRENLCSYYVPTTARRFVLLLFLCALPVLLLTRAASLQWLEGSKINHTFLESKAKDYTTHTVRQPAYRGSVLDRNGTPLAVSIPLSSLWADPTQLSQAPLAMRAELASWLELEPKTLDDMLHHYKNKRFMYLRRHLAPSKAQVLLDKNIPGLAVRTEYQRYYPNGEVSAPLIGITDIDDRGQEGLELSYNKWLSGLPSVERVMQDRKGAVIRNLGTIKMGRDGSDLRLAIDITIQYAAYRALQETVLNHNAKSGSVVVLDVQSGEFLAVVNYPAPNPHMLNQDNIAWLSNRAVVDLMEPGSIIKPFVVAAALEGGHYNLTDIIDTNPGCVRVAGKDICDAHNYGPLTLGGILRHSSQVGIVRLSLNIPPSTLLNVLRAVGVGTPMNIPLPVDPKGYLPVSLPEESLARVTMAYGYGLSGTLLQWARAYSVIANEGRLCLPRLVLHAKAQTMSCRQVISPEVARTLLAMLTDVVSTEGTGGHAQVFGYQVAGKTATIRKYNAKQKRYTGEEHIAAFAGIAPYSEPRIVVVVKIDEPDFYYHGGTVAAPLFAKVASFSLRRLNVAPDNLKPNVDVVALAKSTDL